MSTPVPIPATPDVRVPDPDNKVNVNLRKCIEYGLLHDVQISRDPPLSTRLSENNRSRVQRDSGGSMNDTRLSAEPVCAPPDASQNDEGIFSASPQQLMVSGEGCDGRSEDGYRSAGAAHQGDEQCAEAGEGDTKHWQTYSNVSLTQHLHSKSQISRECSPLYQRHPSSQPVEDYDEEKRDGYQPSSLSQVPRSSSPGSHDTRQGKVVQVPYRRIDPNAWSPWGSLHSHSDSDFEIYRRLSGIEDPRSQPTLSSTSDGTHGQLNDEQLVALHTEASAKMREAAAAQKKVAEAKRKEAEAKKKETEAHRRVHKARQRELEARRNEAIARGIEEEARKRGKEARRKKKDARGRDEDAMRKQDNARQRENLNQLREGARRFEENVGASERNPRPAQENLTQDPTGYTLGSSRHERHDARASEADDTRLEAKADMTNRFVEIEGALPQHQNQSNAQVLVPTKWQRDRTLEQQQHHLKEQRYLEEQKCEEEKHQREREERVRVDEEQERKREDRVRLDDERQAKRLRKDQRRLTEEERLLKEQHRNVGEQNRQRDQAQDQQWQQNEILRQREQKESGRKLTEPYQLGRTTDSERERRDTAVASGASAPHRPAGPTDVPVGSRAGVHSKPNPTFPNPSQRAPVQYTSALKSEEEERVDLNVRGNRAMTKGVPLAGSKLEEERARRTEERARQQQEQLELEQERLESEKSETSSGGASRLFRRITGRR